LTSGEFLAPGKVVRPLPPGGKKKKKVLVLKKSSLGKAIGHYSCREGRTNPSFGRKKNVSNRRTEKKPRDSCWGQKMPENAFTHVCQKGEGAPLTILLTKGRPLPSGKKGRGGGGRRRESEGRRSGKKGEDANNNNGEKYPSLFRKKTKRKRTDAAGEKKKKIGAAKEKTPS